MSNFLLINATPYEIRLGLVENGHLVEFYLERPAEKGLVGNIYRGRVERVLPGMEAAFVDIGLERTGFLYVDDVYISPAEMEKRMMSSDCERSCCEDASRSAVPARPPEVAIEKLLTEGQDLLVQICKEPIGTKGARLTSHITLPCRNLVFMPMTDHIGISRKIENEEVRQALREKIVDLRPEGTGFIVRTIAENASNSELEADMEFLLHLWSEIQDMAAKAPVPSLVHEDLDITLRAVRDLLTPEVGQVIIDDAATYRKVRSFVETFDKPMMNRVFHYQDSLPVFETYGVEMDISRALEKRVWLRSGGYIIIETTEALTVIDVNTGRFVGKNDLEETIFKTNMEAVKEIAYQIRLRNIGGIIIIDFIDMEDENSREALFNALQEAVRKDKSRTNILKLSEFGLVQMTRKRDRDNLSRVMCEPCLYCGGEGLLKSRRSICYEIYRRISRDAARIEASTVTLRVHPAVADMLLKEEAATMYDLEHRTNKRITIVPTNSLHIKQYEIEWA